MYAEVQRNTDTTSRARFSPRTIPFSARKERELRKIFVFTCTVCSFNFSFFNWSLRKGAHENGSRQQRTRRFVVSRRLTISWRTCLLSKRLMPKGLIHHAIKYLSRENHLYVSFKRKLRGRKDLTFFIKLGNELIYFSKLEINKRQRGYLDWID